MAVFVNHYARAFADVITARKIDSREVTHQLASIRELMHSSADLRAAWESPSIPQKQKIGLLDAIAKREGLAKETRNFLAVLIDHGRIQSLDAILRQFQQEMDRRHGVADAEIRSARELDAAEKSALEKEIAALTGKKVRASYAHAPELLGGAVVKVGSTVYDGSVRGQLEKLRQELRGD